MATCLHCGESSPERANFCLSCGRPLSARREVPRGTRKTVTVVFADLVGFTGLGERLDAETLDRVLGRYYEVARKLLEDHGGTVAKFIGDAVVAVFGVPVLHEDDALRAVTAASRLRVGIERLDRDLDQEWSERLLLRIGVNTGEVLAAESGDRETPILSDAVTVAARLEQFAEPGEILIGDSTYRLVRHAVVAESLSGLELKGKSLPVPAWRLQRVDTEAYRHPRRTDTPMVGRESDLDLLHRLLRRTSSGRRFHLVTVLGDGGVGKTRLVDEFEAFAREHAAVLRGRCRSYGEGITYWPIVQMVRSLAGIAVGESREESRRKLAALLDQTPVTDKVAQLLGLRRGTLDRQDTYWALQRILETLARQRPLVLVIDDLHWARPPLLEFVEHLAERLRDSPIMLICVARPELFAEAPRWSGGLRNATCIELPALTGEQTRELVGHLLRPGTLNPELRVLLAEASAGYPLFLEEYVGMLIDDQTLRLVGDRWEVTGELTQVRSPPTIHALLSARLDELREPERLVLGRAAVVGRQFEVEAVTALSPEYEQPEVAASMLALVRKELLRVEAPAGAPPSDALDRFRFRHSLIHEAAYQALPKADRADLHIRYADWLERQAGADSLEVDELLGYHLEQAHHHRRHLGRTDDRTDELAGRAGERLASAGHRAVLRGDIPETAVGLLDRSIGLLPEQHERRLDALLDLVEALRETEDLPRALRVCAQAIELAGVRGDERYAAHATLGLLDTLWFVDPGALRDGGRQEAERVITVLGRTGDDLGLAKAWRVLAYRHFAMGQSVFARQASERAISIARRAGDERMESRIVRLHSLILFWGPTPLDEVVAYTEEMLEWARGTGMRSLEPSLLNVMARATAMRGDLVGARNLVETTERIAKDLGQVRGEMLAWATTPLTRGIVELLAGKPVAAEGALRTGHDEAMRVGGAGPLANLRVMLARALLQQDRDEEAEAMVARCRTAPLSQLDVHIRALGIESVLLARRGAHGKAQRRAADAVGLAKRTEQLDTQAAALMDVAEVKRVGNRSPEARRAAESAFACYQLKGNLIGLAGVESFLRRLERESGGSSCP